MTPNLPDITCVPTLSAVPALLAPCVAAHGPLCVFCDDVTGRLRASSAEAAEPGEELVLRMAARGGLATRARVYPFAPS